MLRQNTKIVHRGMSIQQQAPAVKRKKSKKKSKRLKARVFKQLPRKLGEQEEKDEVHLVPVPRRVSVFNFDGKASKGQRLKKHEERKEVLYRLQTKAEAKEKKLVKGGARGFPLQAPNLHGNKGFRDPGEEAKT